MYQIHLETVDSTNTYAKMHFDAFKKDAITCIIANEQTQGKGSRNKSWYSPAYLNLYVTFAFTLNSTFHGIETLCHILAISLLNILKSHNLSPKIKWPNDVMLNNKKLAGVLCEPIFEKGITKIVLGIGINVNTENLSCIDQPATSLYLETKKIWDKFALLEELKKEFEINLNELLKNGFKSFKPIFEENLFAKGKFVTIKDGPKTVQGTIDSITKDGRLNIKLENEHIVTLTTGTVLLKDG
jgi:BirA family biotin operon repressor/biotin-[acetyl-CoA-carboxylase] ligase